MQQIVNFTNEVLDRKGKALVVCSAAWCGPCKVLAATIDKASAKFESKQITVLKLSADENAELCKSLNVQGIPTMFLYNDGKMLKRHCGVMDEQGLLKWVDDLGSE